MFKTLVNMIREALRRFVEYDNISQSLDEDALILISEDMQENIDLWREAYKDTPPWYKPNEGKYTLGIPKSICQLMQMTVLSEMNTSIVVPGQPPVSDDGNVEITTRADFLNDVYKNKLIKKLPQNLEKAMAMGGMIIKPYVVDEKAYFDFITQGDFLPLAFDDDGNITDIIFIDQFINNGQQFTKLERQTFDATNNEVTVTNKAFKTKAYQKNNDDEDKRPTLGVEIKLAEVPRWANISAEPVIISDVEKPLYGYYKVPIANNIDMNSPLGISVFSPALKLIERADAQFSRLDWEYEGGQIAIDVDASAVSSGNAYYGSATVIDDTTSRLYRKLDLGAEDTYKAFAPQLRDASYKAGQNSYYHRIEDACGLARGTLADDPAEARTATEVSIVKQRSYVTASSNQDALADAIRDSIDALDTYAYLYNLAPEGEYVVNIEWQDNILTDTSTELEQKLELVRESILSKAEVRAWYNGEDLATAQAKIDELDSKSQENQLDDLYSATTENTLEGMETENGEAEAGIPQKNNGNQYTDPNGIQPQEE